MILLGGSTYVLCSIEERLERAERKLPPADHAFASYVSGPSPAKPPIGIRFARQDGGLIIIFVQDRSRGAAAGLLVGDIIASIKKWSYPSKRLRALQRSLKRTAAKPGWASRAREHLCPLLLNERSGLSSASPPTNVCCRIAAISALRAVLRRVLRDMHISPFVARAGPRWPAPAHGE